MNRALPFGTGPAPYGLSRSASQAEPLVPSAKRDWSAPRPITRWGVLWRSKSRLDGETQHLTFENCLPIIFRTRAEARAFIETRYGYIRHRKDLQAEPHGLRLPIPVRVKIAAINNCDRQTDPTARGDLIAARMRAFYEANKPLHWWQRRRSPERQTGDNLMIGLMNIALSSAEEIS